MILETNKQKNKQTKIWNYFYRWLYIVDKENVKTKMADVNTR